MVFADLALQLGQRTFRDYARRFGLEEAPPLEIPTAASRIAHSPNFFVGEERSYALASSGMGQGELALTPLQMALVAATIANDGLVPRPHLVTEVRDEDGQSLYLARPAPWRSAIQRETAQTVKGIMVQSVEVGWARGARLAGVKTAGKTGTAEPGGDRKAHSWFIGFAPADNPVIALALVKEFSGEGSVASAPAARRIFEVALRLNP